MNRKKPTKETPTTPYSTRNRKAEKNNLEIAETDQSSDSDHLADPLDSLDENNTLIVGILKGMMDKMETNINKKIDRSREELKADVNMVKEHLEKYSEKMEEVETRLGDTEDRMDKMGEAIEEIFDFKAEWEKNLTDFNLDQCRMRRNNIIFHGVKGGSKNQTVAQSNFERVCRENLKMSNEWIENVDIIEIYHFPPKGGEGAWPLFVSFAKTKHREDLFRASPNLKDSGITMRNDLAPWLLRFRKKLIAASNTLKTDNPDIKTKLRDTPYKVWLLVKMPNNKDWETWKGRV